MKQTWPNKSGKTNLAFSQKDKQLTKNRWEIHHISTTMHNDLVLPERGKVYKNKQYWPNKLG